LICKSGLFICDRNVYAVYVETKDQIFAAARAAFDRAGQDGLSLRDIAREVGITPMAIYRHYKDKQALVDALVLDALDEWSAQAQSLPQEDPARWFETMGEAFLDFALQKPRRFEAAFLTHTKHARRYPDDFLAGRSPAGVMYLKFFDRLRAQGRLANVEPIEIMITIAGLSQGLITLYRAGRIAGGEAEFRALFLRAMRRSIQSFLTEDIP
jgi:AcrR family transcriptional regulator